MQSFFKTMFSMFVLVAGLLATGSALAEEKRLAYLVSDERIPFWNIMEKGIKRQAERLGYEVSVYSADNEAKRELELTVEAIESGVEGIILSPTNSSAAVTILKLAERSNVPVVISDIGADSDNYVSYIASDNYQGAYDLGDVLASKLEAKGWADGTVGIVAIPQKRANGQARTKGFLQALEERGIRSADIFQQNDFSYQETYQFSRALIARNSDLRAIWLQGSDRYQAALDAIADAGRAGEVLLICFDAEPEFIEMIGAQELVGAGMQQPFLMGEKAVETMDAHLQGKRVQKTQQLPVLAVSGENLEELLPTIRRNVLGQETED